MPEDKSDPQTLVEALRLAQRRSFEAAAALVLRVLIAPSLQHVFNIASGVWLSVRDILATFAAVAPGLRYAIISAYEAEIDLDPGNRLLATTHLMFLEWLNVAGGRGHLSTSSQATLKAAAGAGAMNKYPRDVYGYGRFRRGSGASLGLT